MDNTEGNCIVEEIPPPPSYFKLFTDASLPPPPIPAENPYLTAYNGAFAHIKLNAANYNSEKDYKADLKLQLQAIVSSSAQLVSNKANGPGEQQLTVEQKVLELKNKLGEFHHTLNEYRVHEARETLCVEMMNQLQNAKKLEERLQNILEKCSSLLNYNTTPMTDEETTNHTMT